MFVHLVEGILSHELFGAAQVVRGRDGIEAEVVGQEIAGVFPGEGLDPDESHGGPGITPRRAPAPFALQLTDWCVWCHNDCTEIKQLLQ